MTISFLIVSTKTMTAMQLNATPPNTLNIMSWNVSGIRARLKDKYMVFMERGDYDVVCLQETRAEEKQVDLPQALMDMYPHRHWNATEGKTHRKGRSGTTIWSKRPVWRWIPTPAFDGEGRITAAEFDEFILVNVYAPYSQDVYSERYEFRVCVWDIYLKAYLINLRKTKPVVLCGDLNVAHKDVDVHHPGKVRNKLAGCLDSERDNFQSLLDSGFTDAFRLFETKGGHYTYWDQRDPGRRADNRGWRIDYFLISDALAERYRVKSCEIHPQIFGSDHCPVTLEMEDA
jgi:exodeoxyribonuclease-3